MTIEPITRRCKVCRRPFTIEAAEVALHASLARQHPDVDWSLPQRCTPCRAARRQARYAVVDDGDDEVRRCERCGRDYVFGGRDKQYWARQGWTRPRHCRPCRQARHAER